MIHKRPSIAAETHHITCTSLNTITAHSSDRITVPSHRWCYCYLANSITLHISPRYYRLFMCPA